MTALVLVGAPGAGKTTVGRHLAHRWGLPFLDSDQVVEQLAGKKVAEIFVDEGESAFRDRERAAIAETLADFDGVLSLGGGAVLDPQTRALLELEPCAWLRVGVPEATRRVGLNASRPLLLGNVRGTLITLLDERAPLYEDVATWVIDTDGRTVDEVVEAVAEAVRPT